MAVEFSLGHEEKINMSLDDLIKERKKQHKAPTAKASSVVTKKNDQVKAKVMATTAKAKRQATVDKRRGLTSNNAAPTQKELKLMIEKTANEVLRKMSQMKVKQKLNNKKTTTQVSANKNATPKAFLNKKNVALNRPKVTAKDRGMTSSMTKAKGKPSKQTKTAAAMKIGNEKAKQKTQIGNRVKPVAATSKEKFQLPQGATVKITVSNEKARTRGKSGVRASPLKKPAAISKPKITKAKAVVGKTLSKPKAKKVVVVKKFNSKARSVSQDPRKRPAVKRQ